MLANTDSDAIAIYNDVVTQAGQAANQAARANVFEDYKERKAKNTIRRQDADLDLFATFLQAILDTQAKKLKLEDNDLVDEFLRSAGQSVGDLANDPEAWHGITWGLVKAFVKWQLRQGYAVATVNIRLSTVKTFCKLATQAGAIKPEELAMIRTVAGYQHGEIKKVDEKRIENGIPTRYGYKKAESVSITPAQAKALKSQPDTPQGRRDQLLMCLLLDLGLRCGEVAILTVDNFNLVAGVLTFFRPKINKSQTHRLINDSMAAAKAYFQNDAPAIGDIWRGSRKGKHGLTGQGMTERAITQRVRVLGESVGLHSLSAHDCRHYWATQAARNNTPMDRLQDAGGWSSLAMPSRYIESAKIANLGIRLGED
jgi:integrase